MNREERRGEGKRNYPNNMTETCMLTHKLHFSKPPILSSAQTQKITHTHAHM